MKRLYLAAALSLLAAPVFAGEPAAVLASQKGVVLVNQGEMFETAAESQALNAGDRVMVMEGGSAGIVFADGCQLPLESGSMFVVPAQSTCAGALADVQHIGPSYAQVVGSNTDRKDATQWIILVGAVTVVAAVIAHDDDDDDDEPVSP